jgi:hypothetical protein
LVPRPFANPFVVLKKKPLSRMGAPPVDKTWASNVADLDAIDPAPPVETEGLIGETVNALATPRAAWKFVFPGCAAFNVVVPTPTIVTRFPETVATEEFELEYSTGSPDEAVALSWNDPEPTGLDAGAGKVTVWFALEIVKSCSTEMASL